MTSELAGLQSNVTSELAGLQSNATSELAGLQSNVTSELAGLQSSMISELAGLQSNVTSELAGLQSNVTSELAGLTSELAGLQSNVTSELAGLTSELAGLQSNVTSELAGLTSELAGLQSNVTSELAGLQSNVTSELAGLQSNVTSELAGLQSSTTSGLQSNVTAGLSLAGLQSNITSEVAGLHFSLQSNTRQLTQLCTKVDTFDMKLVSVNDSTNRISDNVEAHDNHVTTELMALDLNLQQNFTLLLKNSYGYITTPPIHTCGGTGGWRRVVYLNFTDPDTPCPFGWQLTSHSKRTCGRVSTGTYTCDSVTFPVSGGDYTRVCGRIIAYQDGGSDAFFSYHNHVRTTIDGAYVCGVILTHGSPRQHIWTFATGNREFYLTYIGSCPCDATVNITIPPFVGGDYFCESGWNSGTYTAFFPDDPLWDGDGCTATSTCCSFNNPPYFTKQLPSPTTDDIEARICQLNSDEDTPIEFIELYVQ